MNNLLLFSGNDIPFVEAQVNIHQPIIREIAYISEESFFMGCELLNLSKKKLKEEDKISLANQTDFEILMSILNNPNTAVKQKNECVLLVLMLLFPIYQINIIPSGILLMRKNEETEQMEIHSINAENYNSFKEILIKMFRLDRKSDKDAPDYNPGNKQAEAMAERFRKAREKAAAAKRESKDKELSILGKYVSILAVGEQKDINSLMNYTVYQLFDEFERFEKKEAFESHFRAQLAGATGLEKVDYWMN